MLGTGPSLCAEDIYAVAAKQLPIIAISDAIRIAPTAAVIYSPDAQWWTWHQDVAAIPAHKFSLQHTGFPSVIRLAPGHKTKIETDPRYLSTGGHGGWSAINLAVHMAPARIVLLGYDFQPSDSGSQHFFGEHPNRSHVRYEQWLNYYRDLPAQLQALGITIVNATRRTAIDGIPRVSLIDALCPSATPSPTK